MTRPMPWRTTTSPSTGRGSPRPRPRSPTLPLRHTFDERSDSLHRDEITDGDGTVGLTGGGTAGVTIDPGPSVPGGDRWPGGQWQDGAVAALCAELKDTVSLGVVTNDIYTTEDADTLRRLGVLETNASRRCAPVLSPHRHPRRHRSQSRGGGGTG